MTDNTQELDVNKLEQIIADHNKEMRTDMASEITGGTRSKSITDVITVKAILDWHNKQIAKARLIEAQLLYEDAINSTSHGHIIYARKRVERHLETLNELEAEL